MRSFRSALALRVAVQALGVGVVLLVGATIYLRVHLLSSVDASLFELARLEAEHGGDSASSEFRFPAPALTPTAVSAATSWAQLLDRSGRPSARSSNLHEALPVPSNALASASRGAVGFATHRWNSKTVRSVIWPLSRVSPAHRDHVLQVTTSLEPLRATLTNFVLLMASLGLAGAGFAWLVGWVIAGRALTPALVLTAEAESIGVNELSRRVTLPGQIAEFDRMAVAFNALLERLEQAVSGTRRFTLDASHELRAPLTVLRGEIELALSRPRAAPEYEEVLRRCLDEVLRLVRLANDLLTLTRIQGGVEGAKRNPVELDDIVARAVEQKAALAHTRGVAVEMSGSAGLVSGDADLLLRAIDALVEHAIMASPHGGQVRLRLTSGHRHSVEVTDGGPGLKPEEITAVFQRFYRSNRPRVASDESGLGLPIARAAALSHGGALEFTGNDPGASFKLSLPPLPGHLSPSV